MLPNTSFGSDGFIYNYGSRTKYVQFFLFYRVAMLWTQFLYHTNFNTRVSSKTERNSYIF